MRLYPIDRHFTPPRLPPVSLAANRPQLVHKPAALPRIQHHLQRLERPRPERAKRVERQSRHISLTRSLDFLEDLLRHGRRRHDARRTAKSQNPRTKGPVVAHAQPYEDRAVLANLDLLRPMPLAGRDVVGDLRVEFDFNELRPSR